MDVSYIVFSISIVCGIFALPVALRGIRKLLSILLKAKEHQEEKQRLQRIEDAKKKLKETLDSGNLSDLINAANDLGKEKRK